jgi:S-formylglutathione hydrolase FrmB
VIARSGFASLASLATIALLASAACAPAATTAAGAPAATAATPSDSIVVDSIAAASFGGKTMRFHVALPPHYDPAHRYPVLWLLHGYGGDDENWIKLTNFVHDAAAYPMIVVLPAVGDSWYVDAVHDTTQRAEEYMIRELPAAIERRFLIDTTRQAIAGLSMGGYGAVVLALRHPDRYTVAGSLSGALSVPATYDSVSKKVAGPSIVHAFGALVTPDSAHDPFALIHRVTTASAAGALPSARLSYFYVAIGTHDGFPTFLPASRAFTDSLRAHRVEYEYHEIPGTHSWKFWGTELPPLLHEVWARIGTPAT